MVFSRKNKPTNKSQDHNRRALQHEALRSVQWSMGNLCRRPAQRKKRVGASQGCGCKNQRGAEVSAAKSTIQNVSTSTADKCIIVALEFRKHF